MSAPAPGSVAVIIPCYNSGATLVDTVASVLAQRRRAREIVVVDDGSDDPETARVLAALPAVVRVLAQTHAGVARARDAGVRETRSDYLLWLDADDLLDSEYLEATARELDHRSELDIVATGFEMFGSEHYTWTPPDPARLELHFAEGTFLVTTLFRRTLWEARGGADPELPALEDWDYWLGALAAGHRAVVLERPLVRVRARPGSRRLRGLEGDRMAPSLRRVIGRHRRTIARLGDRLLEAKTRTLADLTRRCDALRADIARREALPIGAPAPPRAVVLMYHRAADLAPDPFGLCVPPALLARQLEAVQRSFRVVGVTALLDSMVEGSLAPGTVALTFDDGYLDALAAADVLGERGLPAMFFVNTEDLDERHESWESGLEQLLLGDAVLPAGLSLTVGTQTIGGSTEGAGPRRALFDTLHALGYTLDGEGRASLMAALRAWSGLPLGPRDTHRVLTGAEIQALAARPGMEIGVHGARHLALPLHPEEAQEHELAAAKAALEALLQRPVVHLAYAYGAHDEGTVAVAARLGFRSAFSVREAALTSWDDALTLPRIDVGRCDPEALVARLHRLLAASPEVHTPAEEPACAHGPRGARPPLLRCLRGEISPPIALLHLASEIEETALLAFLDETAARLGPESVAARARLTALRVFAQSHLDGYALVRRMGAHHGRAAGEGSGPGMQDIRDLYDRLADMDPEAAVALYSFGDREVLDAATAEVVAYLRRHGLLTSHTRLLDLGCGIGRLLEAFSPHCRFLVGIDVSPRMVALASSRLASRTNVRVELGTGHDLGPIASASQDVVMAADSWPHVVDLGDAAVRRLAEDVARVLAPGGEFVVLNFSHREDASLDVADVRRLASELGFSVVEERGRPFALWDASTWRLRRLEDNPRG